MKEKLIKAIESLVDVEDEKPGDKIQLQYGISGFFVNRLSDLKGTEGEFTIWHNDQTGESDPDPYLASDDAEEVADWLIENADNEVDINRILIFNPYEKA